MAGTVSAGIDCYNDWVGSYRREYDANDSLLTRDIQGPVADDAQYATAGAYLQDDLTLFNRLNLIGGVRLSYARVRANNVQDPLSRSCIGVYDSWKKGVASVRALVIVDKKERVRFFGGVAQSFRAPNLSDLTRFDMAMSNELEVPSPGLKPEQYLTSELGLKIAGATLRLELAGFYTRINGQIIRAPTGVITGRGAEVIKKNSGRGYVAGVEAVAAGSIAGMVHLSGWATYQSGVLSTYPTSQAVLTKEPLSRLMPLTGYGSVRFERSAWPWWVETTAMAAGRQDRLSTLDKIDNQRIPPGGTPGYAVFGIRSGFRFSQWVTISIGIENITNIDYRVHGSGLNEPGRNLVAGMDVQL
jgi:hemoglobin/transferrin/lactoferrin receptor protein